MKRYQVLAVVAPAGANLCAGDPRLEVRRRWPDALPMRDLLIVESAVQLSATGVQEDPLGRAVALVDVVAVTDWLDDDGAAACAVCRDAGWLAWHLENVRPVRYPHPVPARRQIYELELPDLLE